MQKKWIFIGAAFLVVIVVLYVVLGAGNSYGAEDNHAIVHVANGDTLTISLGENPTTGLMWRTNVTPGLVIARDSYSSGNPVGELMGMIGVGGTRSWNVRVTGTGTQTFSASMGRGDIPNSVKDFTITFEVK